MGDKNGDGFVTPEEFDEYLHELEDMAQKETDPDKSAKCERKMAKVQGIKKQIFEEADVDKDGKIDLWEIMAHTLGRKKMPVEILLYDVSKGMADMLGGLLIGKKVAAVHSSCLAFGSEYWYGGQLFRSVPPCRKAFGE